MAAGHREARGPRQAACPAPPPLPPPSSPRCGEGMARMNVSHVPSPPQVQACLLLHTGPGPQHSAGPAGVGHPLRRDHEAAAGYRVLCRPHLLMAAPVLLGVSVVSSHRPRVTTRPSRTLRPRDSRAQHRDVTADVPGNLRVHPGPLHVCPCTSHRQHGTAILRERLLSLDGRSETRPREGHDCLLPRVPLPWSRLFRSRWIPSPSCRHVAGS